MGGAQMCFLDLLPAFAAKRWRVYAAVPEGPFSERLSLGGVTVSPISSGRFRSGAKSPMDLLRFATDLCSQCGGLEEIIARYRIDTVYVNGPRVLLSACLAGKRMPLVFHAHNHVGGKLEQFLLRRCVRSARGAVFACSSSVAQDYQALPDSRTVHVIPNGVPDQGFRDRSFDLREGVSVGIIGQISPNKGQMDFVEAAAVLSSRFPCVQFTICGTPGPRNESYAARVRDLSRNLPIRFLGWQDDVRHVLSRLDLLVIPSASEGMPRVMLESFSAGVPVVAYPVGGIPEAIRDGETGFLVEPCSAQGLAASVESLLAGPAEKLRCVARAARLAWEKVYHVDIYRTSIMDALSEI